MGGDFLDYVFSSQIFTIQIIIIAHWVLHWIRLGIAHWSVDFWVLSRSCLSLNLIPIMLLRHSKIIFLMILLISTAIPSVEGYLAYTASSKPNPRGRVWCHRHADCVSLNRRWCCVPYGNRQLAVNGVCSGFYNKVDGLTRTLYCRRAWSSPEPSTVWCDQWCRRSSTIM